MNKMRDILFQKCTDSWDNNIPVSVRVTIEIFDFNIVENAFILVG